MKRNGMKHRMQVLLSAALLAGGVVGSALADSPCKGLEQRQCEGSSGCVWVDGYVRKDGVKVAAYCKGSGKSSGASNEEEKKAASKEKKSSAKE